MAYFTATMLFLCAWPSLASPAMQESVVNTPHNLSASGPGPIKAPSEGEVCIFCHVTHRAGVTPLWNRSLSNVAYISYKSTTAKAIPGQPTGTSKLCLSCHDGTIALGRLRSHENLLPFTGSDRPRGRKNRGTDLSNDHPVSLPYQQVLSSDPRNYQPFPMAHGQTLLDDKEMVQ